MLDFRVPKTTVYEALVNRNNLQGLIVTQNLSGGYNHDLLGRSCCVICQPSARCSITVRLCLTPEDTEERKEDP